MMFVTDWRMTLVAIVSSFVGFMFMGKIVSRSQKYFIKQQQLLGEMNGHIEEVYAGHNVVKAYNAEQGMYKKFNEIKKRK